ncbi:MAG: methyltransferase domain-containing protein, partial [Anaerolineae bacterium]|nr:methyltransferase domain-containing protein [Anaerolineae bacterium]
KRYANASFILYDVADKMLDSARERFKTCPAGQFEYVIGDYRNLQVPHDFDLIVSSLSIHHLEDPEKEALFLNIYKRLRPGGLFINIDQVRGETQTLRNLYWQRWLKHVHQSGATEEQINESIKRRTTYDRDALLSDQLRWLKESGFSDVDVVYKNFFVAVFLAVKG